MREWLKVRSGEAVYSSALSLGSSHVSTLRRASFLSALCRKKRYDCRESIYDIIWLLISQGGIIFH